MKKESLLQHKILSDLRGFQKNIIVFKIEKTSDDGIPDIFFSTVKTGGIFIEVKSEGECPDPLQRAKINLINHCGCRAFVCDTWEKWITTKKLLF